ncbi:hypothetical protein [Hymenobacter rubripertinctus]|uniref:Uncharacterized protein n=1 Tax=Hymenobacter rubripertinctus TaxID=2029981 RepID=A0A418QQG1_9BACT|nr:hypothetical protein [Hymenobacter rubripertinctus]RIY07362.1 hypothetical protein D0T11_16685 [Hymenobacter rubripertinctus]
MPSKILSFICHVPGLAPGAYASSVAVAAPKSAERRTESRRLESQKAGGHFTAIYENERFVRFKYINNN